MCKLISYSKVMFYKIHGVRMCMFNTEPTDHENSRYLVYHFILVLKFDRKHVSLLLCLSIEVQVSQTNSIHEHVILMPFVASSASIF